MNLDYMNMNFAQGNKNIAHSINYFQFTNNLFVVAYKFLDDAILRRNTIHYSILFDIITILTK